jgi:hypothetical protein
MHMNEIAVRIGLVFILAVIVLAAVYLSGRGPKN